MLTGRTIPISIGPPKRDQRRHIRRRLMVSHAFMHMLDYGVLYR
jgi:hypothetical protein